ncbi:carbon-nitrogen hydrolase family protein [Streptomyces pathocidini]|uniref:carbon-nitrogen hydrolase family protein n=1 Tax=Streptomyces pathocidini TaxID=1650571 RepID=UPI0033FCA760
MMRIALVQQRAAAADPQENLRRGVDACTQAAELGADLVVFPELWQIGYSACPEDEGRIQAWRDLAISDCDPWLGGFQKVARDHGIAVVPTFLREERAGVSNAAAVIDRSGQLRSVYRKVHLCDFSWERALTPGDGFEAVTIETAAGDVRLGVMICYDREFPEAARSLALDGAELIVCPNACMLCDDRMAQIRTRAFENSAALAVANYPLPHMNGRSCVFDGRAVAQGRPRDHRLAVAGPRADLVCADLDLAALREYRKDTIWGVSHRRPHAYRALTALRPPRPAGVGQNGAPR